MLLWVVVFIEDEGAILPLWYVDVYKMKSSREGGCHRHAYQTTQINLVIHSYSHPFGVPTCPILKSRPCPPQ